MKKKIVVGLSGGVDSSVAALLLKQQGYDVIGLFMRNWKDDGECTAADDYEDVRRVCGVLDIPYYTVDLSKQYLERVFAHFISEYKAGRTPNPDVLCNREIKFGHFRKLALELGAEYIATGHYCGTLVRDGLTYLTRALDENKCQTYFLNQVSAAQIENALFPLENLTKNRVRELAAANGLVTAAKKDSTGICFIGEREFRNFLSEYIPMKEGDIRTLDGKVIGRHNGVFFYTVGQRKGFGLGGKSGEQNARPWYIVKKDVRSNVLYVAQGENEELYSGGLITKGFNFITTPLREGTSGLLFRLRHRQPLQSGAVELLGGRRARRF